MGAIKSFREIRVWQKAHDLALEVYRLTGHFPSEEKFGLVSQSRRAVVSIASNIAEGFKKNSKKESCNFYNISEGSLEELKYQILLAKDLGYLTFVEYNQLMSDCDEVGKMLHGWIESQRH